MEKLKLTDLVQENPEGKMEVTQDVTADTGDGYGIPYQKGEVLEGSNFSTFKGYVLMDRVKRA